MGAHTTDSNIYYDLCDRVVGFLFGFSLASSLAAYHLLEEYKLASAALQASVEELQLSTQKVRYNFCSEDLRLYNAASGVRTCEAYRGSREGFEGAIRHRVVEGGPIEAAGRDEEALRRPPRR